MDLFVPLPPHLTSSISNDVPGFVTSRLTYLWLSMFATVIESPLLSLNLSRSFYKACRQYGIQLPSVCTDMLCRSCHMLQIPSITCRVRVKHRTMQSRVNIDRKMYTSTESEGLLGKESSRSISNILVNCKNVRSDSAPSGSKNEIVRICSFCNITNSKVSGGSRGKNQKDNTDSNSNSNSSNNINGSNNVNSKRNSNSNSTNNSSNSNSNCNTNSNCNNSISSNNSLSKSSESPGIHSNASKNSSSQKIDLTKSSTINRNVNIKSSSNSSSNGNKLGNTTIASKKPFSFLDNSNASSLSSKTSQNSKISSSLSSSSVPAMGSIASSKMLLSKELNPLLGNFGSFGSIGNNNSSNNSITIGGNKRFPSLIDLESMQKNKKKKNS